VKECLDGNGFKEGLFGDRREDGPVGSRGDVLSPSVPEKPLSKPVTVEPQIV
jgi:hypothetical protein